MPAGGNTNTATANTGNTTTTTTTSQTVEVHDVVEVKTKPAQFAVPAGYKRVGED